jgi:prepilin-type processing-associated H-X9-DG protein
MGGYINPSSAGGLVGYYYHMSKNKTAVPDGSSNTVAFGEMAGGYNAWAGAGGIPDGVMGAGWVSGFNYSGFGSPYAGNVSAPGTAYWPYFTGQHTGVVNFCFGDGSVRPLRSGMDFTTWVYMTCISDGVVVSFN